MSNRVIHNKDPQKLLAILRNMQRSPTPETLPDKLPASAITLMPGLFQPRDTVEKHIQDLKRAIAIHRHLDPLLVFQAGRDVILIDGHHRLDAYVDAKVTEAIPVSYFEGPLEEAVLAAGRANSKAKLPMTTQQRQDFAWRLVTLGLHSRKQIVEAAAVADGQVLNMRRALKRLGAEAKGCQSWRQAMMKARGVRGVLGHEEAAEMVEAQAMKYADRLSKEFGGKLSSNVEITARAFHHYFGRRLPDLMLALKDHLPDEFEHEELGEDEGETLQP